MVKRRAALAFLVFLIGAELLRGDELVRFYSIAKTVNTPLTALRDTAAWIVVEPRQLLQNPASLLIETPVGASLGASRTSFASRGHSSALWRGRVVGDPGSRVVLTLENGVLAGFVSTAEASYAFLRIGQRYVMAPQQAEPCEVVEESQRPIARQPADPPARAPDTARRLDLLVLYTRAAVAHVGSRANLLARVQLQVDLANTAFADSRVPLEVNIVGTKRSKLAEDGRVAVDLLAVSESSQAQRLRDRYKADLVALVTTPPDDASGATFLLRELVPESERLGFSVVSVGGTRTLAHEIGHNLGMHHNPERVSSPPLFPFAYGHVTGEFATVMACCGRATTHFSNPSVLVEGLATGVVGERDNARTARKTAPLVANYRRSGIVLADDFDDGVSAQWGTRGRALETRPAAGGGLELVVPVGSASRGFLHHRFQGEGSDLQVEFTIRVPESEPAAWDVVLLTLLGRGVAHTQLKLSSDDGGQYKVHLDSTINGSMSRVGSFGIEANVPTKVRVDWSWPDSEAGTNGAVALLGDGVERGVSSLLVNEANRPVREIRLGLPFGGPTPPDNLELFLDDYAARSE